MKMLNHLWTNMTESHRSLFQNKEDLLRQAKRLNLDLRLELDGQELHKAVELLCIMLDTQSTPNMEQSDSQVV